MTLYAHVVGGAVVETTGILPGAGRRQDTSQWVSGLPYADQATLEACGWFPVTEVKPTRGTDQIYGDPTFTINAHDVTATYPVVADTAQNIAARQHDTALANLLAGAATLRTDLANVHTDLAAQATALNTAAATLTTALNATNLPNGATTAQIVAAIRAIGTYLTANKTALQALGNDLDSVRADLDTTIKGLGNFIARNQGSTTVLS
jgi:hypothetical protein